MNNQVFLKSALTGALTLGVASLAFAGNTPPDHAMGNKAMSSNNMVKCYGINAAHKNDCQTADHSCAGLDSKARDPDAYVSVPAGLCEKIAGGSLHSAKS